MCRLFGMTAGAERVAATFWLLDAPDSLEVESRRNVDGCGIGFFDAAGAPVLDKQPEPAYQDEEFSHQARQAESATFVAHVRWATTGGRTAANTHPFAMHGRIMAHNGGFSELARLDERLGSYGRLVLGESDSERYFALITQQTDRHDGDVGAGIVAAAQWIAAHLPVSSLNTVIATPDELWALRYPGQHALHIIERPAGANAPPASSAASVHLRSTTSSVRAPALDVVPSVVIASEQMDGEHGWRMLTPGELIHVRPDLTVETAVPLPDRPARLVTLSQPNPNIDT